MLLLSPSFPVGGFAYSHGLEQAAADYRSRTQQRIDKVFVPATDG